MLAASFSDSLVTIDRTKNIAHLVSEQFESSNLTVNCTCLLEGRTKQKQRCLSTRFHQCIPCVSELTRSNFTVQKRRIGDSPKISRNWRFAAGTVTLRPLEKNSFFVPSWGIPRSSGAGIRLTEPGWSNPDAHLSCCLDESVLLNGLQLLGSR